MRSTIKKFMLLILRHFRRKGETWFIFGISFVLVVMALRFMVKPRNAQIFSHIMARTGQMWRATVCRPGSVLGALVRPGEGFCRNRCASKESSARWCDPDRYDQAVSEDGMIVYVAPGGCEVAAMNCRDSQSCLDESWACMAECAPDPHREITDEGCGCEGNWSPLDGRCVCRHPFVEQDGHCSALHDKDCRYDRDLWPSFVACYAPGSRVEIYWDGDLVHECQGACFTSFCTTKELRAFGQYVYSRGAYREKISVDGRRLESAFSGIGGFYEVCRAQR